MGKKWVTSVLLSLACVLGFNIVSIFLLLSGDQGSSHMKSSQEKPEQRAPRPWLSVILLPALPETSWHVKALKSIRKWIRAEGKRGD